MRFNLPPVCLPAHIYEGFYSDLHRKSDRPMGGEAIVFLNRRGLGAGSCNHRRRIGAEAEWAYSAVNPLSCEASSEESMPIRL